MISHKLMDCNNLRIKPEIYLAALTASTALAIAVPYVVASYIGNDAQLGGFPIEWMGKTVVTLRSPFSTYKWLASTGQWTSMLIGAALVSATSMAAAIASAAALAVSLFQPRKPEKFAKGSWGTRKDAVKAGLIMGEGPNKNTPESPFAIVLGEEFGSLITSTSDIFAGIFGGTRRGKSRLISMTGLMWKESAVFYLAGATNDIWQLTSGYRATFTKVIFFDLSDPSCWRHNALSEIRVGTDFEWDDCMLIATQLPLEDAETARVPYYVTSAINLITAIIQHVINFSTAGERNMESVYKIAHFELPELVRVLENCPIETVRDIAKSYLKGKPEDAKKIMEAAHNALAPWASPVIRRVTRHSDFRLSDLVAEPTSVYLRVPDTMTEQWSRIMKVFISQVRNMLMHDIDMTPDGREKMHELLFAIDEFSTFADRKWDGAMSRIAKYGARILMAMQSPNTLKDKFGQHQTVLENLGIQIYMSSSDPDTQKMISGQIGKATEVRESSSIKADFLNPIPDSSTKSRTEHVRAIMESNEIRTLPMDKQILLVEGQKPFLVTKPIDFTEREPWKSMILPPASKKPPQRADLITEISNFDGVSI